MSGTDAINKVLKAVLQALLIIAAACALAGLIIAGILHHAVRPWAGAFFLALIPCYLLLVKKHLDGTHATELVRTCMWSGAVAGVLALLIIGMLLLLNGIPGGSQLLHIFLFTPLDFFNRSSAFMRYLLLFLAACSLVGLVSGIRALYHRRHS